MEPSEPVLAEAVAAYDLRVSIRNTEPEIWRRLLVPESITVPELHHVLQAAFGWENRHLFGIRCVDRTGQPRVIIGPDAAAEEMGDEPASGVVLRELLDARQRGPSTLEYEYDFGDAWAHRFEVMGPAELPEGTVRCIDGANRGPVEDAGGPYGYARLIEALADPADEEHQELANWYKFATGRDARTFEPYAFDVAGLNGRLEELATRLWPEPPSVEEIDTVVRPVHWLLRQAGSDGLPLTADGYLKPAVVSQAVRELGWQYRSLGAGNRESQTFPVLQLRQQLQAWRLLRKSKGRLVLTPAGRKLHDGGRPLWDYLASAVAFPVEEWRAVVTGLVAQWLLDGSTPSWDARERIIIDTLGTAGFRTKSGSPIPLDTGQRLYFEVKSTLECLQLTVPEPVSGDVPTLTGGGRKFLLHVRCRLEGP